MVNIFNQVRRSRGAEEQGPIVTLRCNCCNAVESKMSAGLPSRLVIIIDLKHNQARKKNNIKIQKNSKPYKMVKMQPTYIMKI